VKIVARHKEVGAVLSAVMAGPVPAIHAATPSRRHHRYSNVSAWMPGTRPGMTQRG
jgi:hypothetical protein